MRQFEGTRQKRVNSLQLSQSLRSSNIILGIKANCSICWGDRGGDSEGAQFGSIIGSRALHNLLNSTLSPKAPFLGSLEFSTRLPLVDRLMRMIFQPQSSIPAGNPGTSGTPPLPGEAASSAAASICHCLPSGAIWNSVFISSFWVIFCGLPYFSVAVISGQALRDHSPGTCTIFQPPLIT